MKKRVGCGAVGLAFLIILTGCSTGEKQSSEPATVTQTATVTTAATKSPTSTYYESSPAYAESSEASVDLNAIRSVKITLESQMFMQKVGDNLFQLSGNYPYAEIPRITWASRSEDGDLTSTNCAVIIDVTGPGNTDERYRSGNCSGSVGGWDSAHMTAFGQYNVKVSVTSPEGGTPVVSSVTYKYIAPGS